MQIRTLSITLLGAFSFILLIKLMMDAQASGPAEMDRESLNKALVEYKKQELPKANAAPPPKPFVSKRVRSSLPDKEESTKPKSRAAASLAEYKAPPASSGKDPGDLRSQMNTANRLYDQTDYEGAREAAIEVLAENDENVRMMRIVVSSSCILGDADLAIKYQQALPSRDKQQMARRCKRYGIEFDE